MARGLLQAERATQRAAQMHAPRAGRAGAATVPVWAGAALGMPPPPAACTSQRSMLHRPYRQAEAAYCRAALADTEELQERLYREMRGRIQEADQSAPLRQDAEGGHASRQGWHSKHACHPILRSKEHAWIQCLCHAGATMLRASPAAPSRTSNRPTAVSSRLPPAPRRYQSYFYYTRTEEGQQYAVHCRRRLPDGAGPPSEADAMDDSVPGAGRRVGAGWGPPAKQRIQR
jgi:hypothetical protein